MSLAALAALAPEPAQLEFDPIRELSPHEPTPKQLEVLNDTSTKEWLYGGAAGGGKSDLLLMRALKYTHVPGYSALILRRTFQQLNKADALIPRAHEWFAGKAHWNGDARRWTFKCPGGGTSSIEFGHLEHETSKLNFQGAAFNFIGFDELTQYTETQYRYLLSRLRKATGSGIPSQMGSTSNPGGPGHDWVFERFVNEETRGPRAFYPAKLEDNPHLDQEDYRESLAGLDKTTRMQLEEGLWVRDTTGLVYRFNRAKNLVEALPSGPTWSHVLGLDYGTNGTALVEWAFSRQSPIVFATRAYKERDMDPEDAARMVKTWEEALKAKHGRGYERMVGDTGGLGKGYTEYSRRRWYLPIEPADKANKLGYQRLMNSDFERQLIQVVRDDCVDYIEELENLMKAEGKEQESDSSENHCCDGGLYGWKWCRHYMGADPGPPKSADELLAERIEREKAESIKQAAERAAAKQMSPRDRRRHVRRTRR